MAGVEQLQDSPHKTHGGEDELTMLCLRMRKKEPGHSNVQGRGASSRPKGAGSKGAGSRPKGAGSPAARGPGGSRGATKEGSNRLHGGPASRRASNRHRGASNRHRGGQQGGHRGPAPCWPRGGRGWSVQKKQPTYRCRPGQEQLTLLLLHLTLPLLLLLHSRGSRGSRVGDGASGAGVEQLQSPHRMHGGEDELTMLCLRMRKKEPGHSNVQGRGGSSRPKGAGSKGAGSRGATMEGSNRLHGGPASRRASNRHRPGGPTTGTGGPAGGPAPC